ncbi:MAG: hypothetical protein ACR2RV_22535, partial [Verrucomicrobiales bacterium]
WEDAPTDPSAEESSESPSPARPAPNLAWVEKVADVMLCETRPDTPARVDLNVIIDRINEGAVPMRLTGRIQGKELAWQKIPLQSLDATFFYENKLVSITDIELVGQRGVATALARYDLTTSQLSIEDLVSTMDPIVTLGYLEADWFNPPPEIEYDTPPRLTSEILRVNFRNPEANEFLLAIDAPDGIRYRDGPGEDDALTFKNFRGSIEFGKPQKLRLRNLEATLNGIDLGGQITFLSRPVRRARELEKGQQDNGQPPTAAPGPGAPTVTARLNQWLTVEAAPDNRPSLNLDMVLDPEKSAPAPPALQIVSGKLSGSGFGWHGHAIESALAQFKLNEGVFEFDEIQLSGVGGQLEANGSYDTELRILKIPKLSSSLNLAGMKSELGLELPPPLDSITFPGPPKLGMSGVEYYLDDVRASRGRFDLQASEGLTLIEGDQTLAVDRFEMAMEWSDPELLSVERAAGRIGNLDFSVDGEWRWGGASEAGEEGAKGANATGSPDVDPDPVAKSKPFSVIALVNDFLTFEGAEDPVQLTSQFVWHESPNSTSSAKWTDQLELSAQISGGKHRWRGYSVIKSGAKFILKDGRLAFTPMRVETTDGTIESQGHYDIAQNQLRLASLQFGLDPLVALERLGVPAKGAESYIHFSTPPVFTGRDLVFDLDDWMGSFGTLKKTNQSGFTITTPKKRKVTLENAQGELTFRRGVIEANGFTAEVFRGDANLEIKIDAARKPSAYDLDFTVTNVSLASFNRWANPKKPNDDTGTFNLTFKAKGTTVPDSMQGVGRATIGSEEPMAQNFLALKGLVGALEGLFPILDGERSWELDLPFSVDGSKITTDATKLSNARTTAEISGYVDLAKDETDLVANVNLRGLLGVAGILVKPLKSDFLEFYGTGSPRDIQWESDEPPEPESEGKDEEEDEGGLRLPRLRRD